MVLLHLNHGGGLGAQIKKGGQGSVMWFRSALRSNGMSDLLSIFPLIVAWRHSFRASLTGFALAGLVVVEPKKADKWDNRVDKSHN